MKLLIIVMLMLLVSGVCAYSCIYENDNDAVKEFKSNMNKLALQNDIEKFGITQEGFNQKLKYFWKCR